MSSAGVFRMHRVGQSFRKMHVMHAWLNIRELLDSAFAERGIGNACRREHEKLRRGLVGTSPGPIWRAMALLEGGTRELGVVASPTIVWFR